MPLRGFWFGIFNPVRAGKPSADLHLSGSIQYSEDGHADWAADPEWVPKSRYLKSKVLEQIYQLAYRVNGRKKAAGGPLGIRAEYALCLGYSAFLVQMLVEEALQDSFLGSEYDMGLAVGFDSGDHLSLGKIRGGELVGALRRAP